MKPLSLLVAGVPIVVQPTLAAPLHEQRAQQANSVHAALEPIRALDTAHIERCASDRLSLGERINALEQEVRFGPAGPGFSTTTKLSGRVSMVLGSSAFLGSWSDKIAASQRRFGGTSFNYDTKLELKTSFTGQDMLLLRLRSGNFSGSNNTFGGSGPSVLSQLEMAFQHGDQPNQWAIDRAFYRVPVGDFTFTLGPRVGQDNLMAIFPSRYPDETLLDHTTMGGAIGANDMNLGGGFAAWWKGQNLAISALHVSRNAESSNTQRGGLTGLGSGSSTSIQLGYDSERWSMAAIYTYSTNAVRIIPYGTPFLLSSISNPGTTQAYGLTANWSPEQSGWIPTISAGWGRNQTHYHQLKDRQRANGISVLAQESQSWTLAMRWDDAWIKGNQAGLAIGQPAFATSQVGGGTTNDGNFVWEAWYRFQVSDHISITPGAFYLSRPLGQQTAQGQSFSQLGTVLKTTITF